MRKCYICKQKRPKDKVSVSQKQLFFNGLYVGNMIMTYCNDDPHCKEMASAAMATQSNPAVQDMAVVKSHF